MEMNNDQHGGIFTPPDRDLLKSSEKDYQKQRRRIVKLQKARAQYWCAEAKRLKAEYDRAENDENLREKYFRARNQLIKHARPIESGGEQWYLDKETTNTALSCLIELYGDLLKGICQRFCKKNEIPEGEVDDWHNRARSVFCKLVTGDTPWAITRYMHEESPTEQTRIDLSEIDVAKRFKETIKWSKKRLAHLRKLGIRENELRIAKEILDITTAEFPKWVMGIGKPLNFEDWLRRELTRQARIRETRLRMWSQLLSLEIVDKSMKEKYIADINQLRLILTDKNLFQKMGELNRECLAPIYSDYIKGVYKEQKFDFSRNVDFTTFLKKFLPLHLSDVYKRKELKPRTHVPIEELSTEFSDSGEMELITEPSTEINAFLSRLTPQERNVIGLRKEGMKNVEIAEKLEITEGRVTQLSESIKEKAKKFGLLQP